ncbi:MAG: class I SAM-dependent methyltransferase [Candidatus Eisenbacteria bacterium]
MEFTGERLVPTAEGWDDLFLEHAARYAFAAPLARGARVLDAACGCGYGSYHLARSGAASVTGVDLSGEAIAYARERFRHDGLAFAVGDVTAPSFAAASFDRAVAFEVFEHLEDPERFLDEMIRVLDPEGVLLVSTPNAATYGAGGPDGKNPFHIREYGAGEFLALLEPRFRSVRLWTQAPLTGLGIVPAGEPDPDRTALAAEIRPLLLPPRSLWGEPGPVHSRAGGCAYFVAAVSPAGKVDGRGLVPGLFTNETDLGAGADRWTRTAREMNEAAARLERELEDRTRWAKALESRVAERDDTIRRLQREFEERSTWALELDRKVRDQERLIESLRAWGAGAAPAAGGPSRDGSGGNDR